MKGSFWSEVLERVHSKADDIGKVIGCECPYALCQLHEVYNLGEEEVHRRGHWPIQSTREARIQRKREREGTGIPIRVRYRATGQLTKDIQSVDLG